MVHQCENKGDFTSKVASGTTIVDFTATWCGPCKMIAPFFEELSGKYPSVQFIKVDVDELDDVSSEAGVSAMPSFFMYKDGAKIDELVGASKEKLEAMVAKHQ